MFHPYIHGYMIAGIAAAPDIFDAILKDIAPDDPVWDIRPDPDRFTVREVLAHLADWEPIWRERMARIRREDRPVLENVDEEQMAIDHDYAYQDPRANLLSFRRDRKMLVHTLRELSDGEWNRIGMRPPVINELSLEAMAAMIAGHDGYHAQQILHWLAAGHDTDTTGK